VGLERAKPKEGTSEVEVEMEVGRCEEEEAPLHHEEEEGGRAMPTLLFGTWIFGASRHDLNISMLSWHCCPAMVLGVQLIDICSVFQQDLHHLNISITNIFM
jgi:hypothetical protein